MSTTFTWNIADLVFRTSDGIVFTAHYTVNAVDDIYEAGSYGSVNLPEPAEGDTVIPYNDITPEIAVGWVKDTLGDEVTAEIQDQLQIKIDEQRNPIKASGLPW